MKIAQIAPIAIRVPPAKYGGTELICSLLTEELVRQGHDVTLFATGDSKTAAKLKYIIEKPIGVGNPNMMPIWTHFAFAFESWKEFDVIHNHGGMFGLIYAPLVGVPMITTLHNLYFESKDSGFVYFKKQNFVSISKRQKELANGLNIVDVIYNAIDIDKFKLDGEKEDYLLWLSNCVPDKGPDVAIKVAKELDMKLVMCAKIDRKIADHVRYFEEEIKPHIDGKKIIFKEEVTPEEKAELFRKAACFLFPIRWEEPFGMVMAEAMACGTPVVAYRCGAVFEVVKDGKTGYVVDKDDYKNFVKRVKDALDGKIDSKTCRRHVEENFTPQIMAEKYLRVYERLK